MAIYRNAIWSPGNSAGGYWGGPWRIVWHTTEVYTAQEAIALYRANNSWPHFTVDEHHVFQHVNTSVAARALENAPGGVQTNFWHAVQIELVSQAGSAKPPDLLALAARLGRWIEQTHGVPKVWPNGYPIAANNGQNPGGHNRNAETWKKQGGHYGHCHVPENSHWDPGTIDIAALMAEMGDFPTPPANQRYA